MGSEITDIIIPSIAFFVSFFIIFALIEALMSLTLNYFIFCKYSFFTNVIMRHKVYHGRWINWGAFLLLLLIITVLLTFTPLFDLLWSAPWEIKIFALEMFLAMILIYLMASRRLPPLHFIKKVYRYLYLYLSVAVYALAIVLVSQYYDTYKNYINATITFPLKNGQAIVLENDERKKLLTEFRHQIYTHDCPRTDLTEMVTNSDVQNLMYITTHQDLKIATKPINKNNPKAYLTGRLCSNGQKTFLLTDYGQWYWVIESQTIAKVPKS